MSDKLALVFDTSNEKVVIGIGSVSVETLDAKLIDGAVVESKRASNQKLLPEIEKLFKKNNLNKNDVCVVGVGIGPGSFTGVRIALATAKGICVALKISLFGISTLDAIAENVRLSGFCGNLLVVADAMRGEIYPVKYDVTLNSIKRKNADTVIKPDDLCSINLDNETFVTGDALLKYEDKFKKNYNLLQENLWYPTTKSLLSILSEKLKKQISPFDNKVHDPAYVLPVYTRLSDAEEHEISQIRKNMTRNLVTGVQGKEQLQILRCSFKDVLEMSKLESENFDGDAWSKNSFTNDINLDNRVWFKGVLDGEFVGYVGASYSGDEAEILKVCVSEKFRKCGHGKKLMHACFETLRNLGVMRVVLDVRKSNKNARAFYEKIGFEEVCERNKLYSTEDGVTYSKDISSFLKHSSFYESSSLQERLKSKKPLIFSIESSCDETACAIVDGCDQCLSSVVSSSSKFHARFGGVVPEIASRKHIEVISLVANETLNLANFDNFEKIDAVAVTSCPGLVGSLVVGVAFAKGISWALSIPLIAVDHLIGHLFANKLSQDKIVFPAVASLISGGNTMLISVKNWGDMQVLGGTIDDAVGEAFDKVAREMNLPYPGGPEISELAKSGNPNAISLPRPLLHSHDLKMSLSGLKTAVILEIEKLKRKNEDAGLGFVLTSQNMCDVCASFEQSICDVQIAKARDAIRKTHAKTFCFGGGVAANDKLRESYKKMCDELDVRFVFAPSDVCGDNAVMIGLAAQFEFENNNFVSLDADVSSKSYLNSRE